MRVAPAELQDARLVRLRARLEAQHLDALLVTCLQNVAYLTGLFASAAAVIVTRDQARVVTDHRYREALLARTREWPALTPVILPLGRSYDEVIAQELAALAGLRVGFEDADLSVRRLAGLRRLVASSPAAELIAAPDVVEDLRVVKDAWELEVLRDAAGRLSDVAKCILPKALEGSTERKIAAELEAGMRQAGFDRPAFDTIVASGPNGALPHHRAGDRQLQRGDLVVIDFGGVLNGYAVDMSRTVAVGAIGARERQVLDAVAAAHAAALRRAGSGVAPEDVDLAAREVLQRAGLGDAFTHGTGHGLGLDVHERPRIGPARPSVSEPPLAVGMVFTIEPGAYIPGWGGVRIEDDVVVTAAGSDVLTDVPSTL
jgi:Xaa-Pro aminopeptidase